MWFEQHLLGSICKHVDMQLLILRLSSHTNDGFEKKGSNHNLVHLAKWPLQLKSSLLTSPTTMYQRHDFNVTAELVGAGEVH